MLFDGYIKHKNGVIEKVEKEIKVNYGLSYSSKYDKFDDSLSYLRLGILLGCLGYTPSSIVDIGYGNGSFIKVASTLIKCCKVYDITSEYPIPTNVEFLQSIEDVDAEVVTLFDSLEHFTDIYLLRKISAKYICISVPWCKDNPDKEWFMSWAHFRPEEHFWHFSHNSLKNFMKELGYSEILHANYEDAIRISENKPNILTAIFKRDVF